MNSNNNNIQNQPVMMPTSAYVEDEINLFELWQVLMDKKWWIISITTLISAVAIVVVLLLPRIYEVTAYFYPPKAEQVAELPRFDATTAYQHFVKNLKSRSVRRQFFNQQKMFADLTVGNETNDTVSLDVQQDTVFEESFHQLLAIKTDKKDSDVVSITYQGKDKDKVRDWVNHFISFTQEYTLNELTSGIIADVKAEKKAIDDQIIAKRALAQQQVNDRIVQLSEALSIAKALQIIEERPLWQQKERSISLSTQNIPDYTRGSLALFAEITSLKNRQSNDPFIGGLRALQEQLKYLETSLIIDKSKIQVVSIEQAAKTPAYPIKPKRKLIVIIAFILGFMFSVFFVFILNMVENAKKEKDNDKKIN